MVFTVRIDSDTRARVFYLRQVKGLSTRKVAELSGISRGSVVRISREKRGSQCFKTSTDNVGRPRKLTSRQGRLLLRCVRNLRREEGNFSAKRVMGRFEKAISIREILSKPLCGQLLDTTCLILFGWNWLCT